MSFTVNYNFAQVARDSGFQLRSYKDGHLDWRLVGSVEIERVLREQNLEQIDSVLSHLAEVPLGTLLETNILDTGIAKYFLLSQFAIQYLLFCRKFLEETVTDLREAHGTAQMEIATLKRSLSESNSEILQLHKKVTQMEAIHEVIYPCHLCTKNFVSNDALNLHISRKHNSDHVKLEIGRAETPTTATIKDREKDMNLINAIKLELEVKHLKERLNNAERKIKENSTIPAASNAECCCDKAPSARKHSIGIQSNLCEIKENDEVSDGKVSTQHHESTEQLSIMQENLQELYQWKKEQQKENDVFLVDIERKFNELKQALETSQKQQNSNKQTSECIKSTTFKELEEILNKKVEDIVKSSGSKIDDVINKMEMSCNNKLEKLERQLETLTVQTKHMNQSPTKVEEVAEIPNIQKNVRKKEDDTITVKQAHVSDNSALKTITKTQLEDCKQHPSFTESSDHSSSPSNNTFIKSHSSKKDIESEDTSDLSDELENVDDLEEESSLPKAQLPKKHKISPPRTIQKPVTRKEVNKLADSRLLAFGIDKRTKSISQASKARIIDDLNKRRNAIKNKHPHFYATRNKIKKFVDKLCSTKMPDNAGKLLRNTKILETSRVASESQEIQDSLTSDEDSEASMEPTKISTPKTLNTNTTQNMDFRQRLENILASPINKPEDHYASSKTSQQQRSLQNQPVPLPRKRVMFNQENF